MKFEYNIFPSSKLIEFADENPHSLEVLFRSIAGICDIFGDNIKEISIYWDNECECPSIKYRLKDYSFYDLYENSLDVLLMNINIEYQSWSDFLYFGTDFQ